MTPNRHHKSATTASGYEIEANADKCVGCNRCARICPIETANIAYQDENGQVKVKIDHSQCIQCGLCITVCKHGARHTSDDLEIFFSDLAAGKKISIITAPSIRTNIPQWQQLFTWLRGLGVGFIYDVALGADICIWAHLRTLEKKPSPIITQPCPVIVAYCEQHRHQLLPYLSPVHSPMACTAIYMRSKGINHCLASLSPCLAKSTEHRSTGLVQYNITFARLLEYIQGIELPQQQSGFDHHDAGPGSLFPLPGGLKENLEFFAGKSIHVEKAEGKAVYEYLDRYAASDKNLLPDVFDVLNCADGCLIGTGCAQEQNIFAISKTMNQARGLARKNLDASIKRLAEYDRRFKLEDFCRNYQPIAKKHSEVSDEQINRAFNLMNKHDYAQRNFDCGACGSDSCYIMARKIVLGVNMPHNCLVKASIESQQARERNANYLSLVKNIGDNLFATMDETYELELMAALRILSESIGCDAVAIWRRSGDKDSTQCERVNGWYGDIPELIAILKPWPEDWVNRLKNGESVQKNVLTEEPGLFPDIVTTLFTVPIHLRGEFWGFVDAISIEERNFSPEDASLLEAAGILLISGILERELNQTLVSAREDAIAGTRAKSDFLSRMSHEMRTPMNAIIGMTHIASAAEDIERKDYCLTKISDASTHLLGVINDILDMSKIEANKFELAHTSFNLEKMLRKVVDFIGFRVEEKKHHLAVYIDSQLPGVIESDEQRLAQVVANLLSNAVKFTPENGSIKLSAILDEENDGICTIRITVSDTGIGVSDEQKPRLFQSFEQADNSTWRKFGGTGLGLAISKRIIELMDGLIWVESAPGQGSSFIFTIRAKRGHDQAGADFQAVLAGQQIKILAVDDALEVREYFSEISRQLGIHCDTAASAEQALALLQNNQYHICFVDWQMPGMDGVELTRRIKMNNSNRTLVTMISGIDWSSIEEQARQAGVDSFIGKPLFPSHIVESINQCLGQSQRTAVGDRPTAGDINKLNGRKILIAEDMAINREIVKALLKPTGLLIDFAENGKVALDKFKLAPEAYAMILMDIQMPDMDGLEATRLIRQQAGDYARQIPIVAMTANVFREDIESCLACGMNDHVGKPVDYNELVGKLLMYIDAE